MRLESLRVELRPRSAWEAMELGTALVRANARAVWRPWLLVTLPVFVALNAVAAALDAVWAAWLLMWWLKPAFDRIPLFVLSRAVFGDTPGLRETLAAQRTWGWRAMRSALTWRRFSLARALTLPVDLLEGVAPAQLAARRSVIGSGIGGHVVLLTLVCVAFIVALTLSLFALALLFVPSELLMSESLRALWALVKTDPPAWAQVLVHAAAWLATSLVEPFYIGAGFGLYLNRRTQIEAWDVEIALRRMRARLAGGAATLLLAVLALGTLAPRPALAMQPTGDDTTTTAARTGGGAAKPARGEPLASLFGDDAVADAQAQRFRQAVRRAYADPLLRPTRRVDEWTLRRPWEPREPQAPPDPSLFKWLSSLTGLMAEAALWLLLAALVMVLALTAKRWWPWLRGRIADDDAPSAVAVSDATLPDLLPDDIATAARALWREGRPRRALALLYRASVEAMARRADVVLVPGATEAECLRASKRMPEAEDRDAFARMVRTWQYAAYAQRLPDSDGFDALLATLSRRFGWSS